jgi:hypothetical protein
MLHSIQKKYYGGRLREYNVSATIKYDLPTKSFVIYLRPTNQIATTPYQVKIPHEGRVQGLRHALVNIASGAFPARGSAMKKPETLMRLPVKVSTLQTPEEVQKLLFSGDRE